MLARDFQSVSIHKSCYERSRRFFFASRWISTIRARFEFWRSNAHPVLFHRLGRRIPYVAFGGARVHVVPLYSRIVDSTASTACKPANLPFQTRKTCGNRFFVGVLFPGVALEGLYIYIVAIGAGPLSLQSKVLLTVQQITKWMILLRKKSGKYPIIYRVLYIPGG